VNALLLLIPLAVVLLLFALGGLIWAVRRGQFDDLDTPALEPLSDDDRPAPAERSQPTRGQDEPGPWKD
jgi:cbb3-type cytochrome oxidase maturation protein